MKGNSLEYIQKLRIHELRDFARQIGVSSPTTMKKEALIEKIHEILDVNDVAVINETSPTQESLDFFSLLTSQNSNIINDLIVKSSKIQEGHEPVPNENGDLSNTLIMKKCTRVDPNMPYNYPSKDFVGINFNLSQQKVSFDSEISELEGYLDIHPNGYGIVRYNGFVPDSRDAYLTLALVKKYKLQKGDYVRGKVKYILEGKPKVMFDIISIDGNPDDPKFTPYEETPYKQCGEKFYLDKFNLDIARGNRIYIKNMGIADAVKLGFDLVDENGVNVKLVNLKALPEESFNSHQKMQIINCPFNRTEIDAVDAVELVFERAKREFENNKSNVVIIYNFSELIRMYNVAIEGYFTYDKFNAKAINKLSNILSMAKYFDENKNLTLICIEKTDVNEDVKTLITSEFMPLFKVVYDMNEVNSYKDED